MAQVEHHEALAAEADDGTLQKSRTRSSQASEAQKAASTGAHVPRTGQDLQVSAQPEPADNDALFGKDKTHQDAQRVL